MILWREGPAPDLADYRALRAAAGMRVPSPEAASRGLPGTLHAVTGWDGAALVAMGRLIGDGGCHAQVTDIAVTPAHQGRGHGSEVVRRLMSWAETHLPGDCFISLIADPGAEGLYVRAGFTRHTGMARFAARPATP